MRSLILLFFFLSSSLLSQASLPEPARAESLTPLTLEVLQAPIPVKGSDGRTHWVYELRVLNPTPLEWEILEIQVLGSGPKDKVLVTWSGEEIKKVFGLVDGRGGQNKLARAQAGILWAALEFSGSDQIPTKFFHRLKIKSGKKKLSISGGSSSVQAMSLPMIQSPLKGKSWVAADGCCHSIRHVRALLGIQGQAWLAQRFAIDWEQLGPDQTLFLGDPSKVENYFCYGQEVHAVEDGLVIQAIDGLPNQVPGKLPANLKFEEADGNHIIQKLDQGHYALYAHLKPGSLKVKVGDRVQRGQVLGQVGNSGNTSEPHLHFHVMDGPSALAANGLPYVLTKFKLVGQASSTKDFDEAAAKGGVLKTKSTPYLGIHEKVMPLDLNLIDF